MFSRGLLTTTRKAASGVCGLSAGRKVFFSAMPANLKLADEAIFHPPPPSPVKSQPYLYEFPLMKVPADVPVHVFGTPGAFADTAAPLAFDIFSVAIRKDIVHDNVRHIRHQRRQPNKTKRMTDISGSNKKPSPQKGTATSQVGNKRNSSWRGGIKAHGPVLRDFSIKINRKVRALGMMMVFTAKFREGNLLVVDALTTPSHKTKELFSLMTDHGIADANTLFIDEDFDVNFLRASKNIPKCLSMERRHMNVYTILQHEKLVVGRDTFEKIQAGLLAQYHHKGRMRTVLARQELLANAQLQE